MTANATLIYDVAAKAPYGGSCGLVARALRLALRDCGHRVRETWVPVRDKTSEILLRAGRSDRVRIVFEELYPRCKPDGVLASAPNLVFFNLRHFRFPEHCSADGLIFNSRYLMDCFLHEAFSTQLPTPPATYIPLVLPLHDFPDGYRNLGSQIDRGALATLADEVHLGHALRPMKADPFATLSIMHHLNQLAIARSSKPFLLLVSARDWSRFTSALGDMPLPGRTIAIHDAADACGRPA